MPSDLLPFLLAHLGKESCLILSGKIGAGKTHAAEYLVTALKESGFVVGGVLSPRVVQDGETVGYTVRDLATDDERPFAALTPPGMRVGKFFIAEEGITFACGAIERAAEHAQVVFVDEVGRLELAGGGLAPAVRVLLRSAACPILLVRSVFVDAVVRTFAIAPAEELAVQQEIALLGSEGKAQNG